MTSTPLELTCPKCDIPIPAYLVNVTNDTAECTVCDSLFKASELEEKAKSEQWIPGSLELPKRSRILVTHTVNSIKISLPATGLIIGHLITLPFITLWFGFVIFLAFKTYGSDVMSIVIDVVMISVGVFIWYKSLKGIFQKEFITIEPERIVFTEKFILTANDTFTWEELENIRLNKTEDIYPAWSNFGRRSVIGSFEHPIHLYNGRIDMKPTIISSKGTYYFFIRASDEEKQWVVAFLNHQLKEHISV